MTHLSLDAHAPCSFSSLQLSHHLGSIGYEPLLPSSVAPLNVCVQWKPGAGAAQGKESPVILS